MCIRDRKGVAFICVPIIYKDDVIGTLSIDRKVEPDTDLKADYHLLDTIARQSWPTLYTPLTPSMKSVRNF